MEGIKQTALFQTHVDLGAKMVEFGGFNMPIEYSSLVSEHMAVRTAAGIFDVSHMGEIQVDGVDALAFIQKLLSNDFSKLEINKTMYTLMLNEQGGVVDDLLVYRTGETEYLLVVNASNLAKDWEWINKNAEGYNITLKDLSPKISLLALQGPKAAEILQKASKYDLSKIDKFTFCQNVDIFGFYALVSRTGYTGEDGFEIYTDNDSIVKIWNKLLELGKDDGLMPCGLGCRDTLRFEAGMPLYGNEIEMDITPLEAGLGFFVKLDKPDFIGKDALVKQKAAGIPRKSVGFELEETGIARHGYEVYSGDEKIGVVTTGYMLPNSKKSVGVALIDAKYANQGDTIQILVRKSKKNAKIVGKKFM